jgi:hypothetical protein
MGRLHPLSPKLLFGRHPTPSSHRGLSKRSAHFHERYLKPIQEVRVGDWVWARGPDGSVKRQVSRLFRHSDKAVLHVRYARDNGEVNDTVATTEHPFWVQGKGWVAAQALQPGDRLLTLGAGPNPRVTEISSCDLKAEVFNFEVEGAHNYFVGCLGVLVHNASVERLSDVWGSKDGIELPSVGSERFKSLVQGIHDQFATTKSYAVLPTPFNSAHPAPGRLPMPSGDSSPGIYGSFAGIDRSATYKSLGPISSSAIPSPTAIGSMESLRVWGHHLLRESFGGKVASLSHAQYHYASAQPAQTRASGTASWHTDGAMITYGFTVSTEGPGTDVLSPHPTKPGQKARRYGPSSLATSAPTWWLTVFTGDGISRHPQSGHLPTVHRTPPSFAVDRSLYLVRVGDGLGRDE